MAKERSKHPPLVFDSRRVILATLGPDRKWMLASLQRNANTSPDVLDLPVIVMGNTDDGQVLWMAGGYRSETTSGISSTLLNPFSVSLRACICSPLPVSVFGVLP
jgi:hypothetical protein